MIRGPRCAITGCRAVAPFGFSAWRWEEVRTERGPVRRCREILPAIFGCAAHRDQVAAQDLERRRAAGLERDPSAPPPAPTNPPPPMQGSLQL